MFLAGQDKGSYLSPDIPFSFFAQISQVMVIDVSYQNQIYDACVFALGVVADEIGSFQISQPLHNAVDDLVHAHHLAHHGLQLRKKRVIGVGRIVHVSAVFL